MLDISQSQLFVASIMWTTTLLCSFCKCLNYTWIQIMCKQSSDRIIFYLSGLCSGTVISISNHHYHTAAINARCTALLHLLSSLPWPCSNAVWPCVVCAAVLGCRLRSYWPGACSPAVSGCMSAVCTAAADSFIACFHRIMHWWRIK